MGMVIGIDVGGTFTDAALIDNDTFELISTAKVPTTHKAKTGVAEGIIQVLQDIMEKNSSESYFIQICDFVSFFVHLYFKIEIRKEELPKRVGTVIDKLFVKRVMVTLKEAEKLNLKANETNMYGLVIYPK